VRFFDFAYEETPDPPFEAPAPATPSPRLPSIDTLLDRAASGGRLSPDEGLRLYHEAELLDLGRAADHRRASLHPSGVVTYIVERNVNYTNRCITACTFCNFFRPMKSREGFTLSREVLAQKLAETVALGGTQILLQGGVNPDLPLSYYEDLFRWIKAGFPLALHALSPEEISFIAENENRTIGSVLERLVHAGLDSVPGGGAEILDDDIRHRISPLKCSTRTWLTVMREAHRLGLRSSATMVFGFGETPTHIMRHLERLRALQSQTAGFTAFICWPFQAEGTRLRLKDDTSVHRYLRVFALARLYLDTIPNFQVSWPTMGPDIGQIALRFGGNDFGSTMIEENVVSQAGAVFRLSSADIERHIRAAGFVPRRRTMRYELLPETIEPPAIVAKGPPHARSPRHLRLIASTTPNDSSTYRHADS
jgi:cyclic dehypoxanthinyl futalosine synthase